MIRALVICALAVTATGAAGTSAPERDVRLGWIDVHVDPKGSPLAAWQVEVRCPPGVRVVGIEGGEHAAWKEPPHHDPRALQEPRERLVLCAYSLEDRAALPTTAARVTTVMVEIPADLERPAFDVSLVTAATVGGDAIPADIRYEVGR